MGKPYLADMKFCYAAAQRNIKRIIELLKTKQLCVRDVANELHISHNSASAYVNYLHHVAKPKQVYIADWEEKGVKRKVQTAIYATGNLPDKPKPKPKTSTEKSRLRSKRIKEQRENNGWIDRRTIGGPNVSTWKPKADPLVAALHRPLTEAERDEIEQLDKNQQWF